jgi:hypothetical protein
MSKTARLFAMGAVMATLAGVPLVLAQEPGATKQTDSKAARKASDPSRRVPRGFGQIGLTPEQREKIYGIQAKHMDKITALEKELEGLRQKMYAECETVLTDSQKQLLAERRAAMRDRAKSEDEPGAEPAVPKKTGLQ